MSPRKSRFRLRLMKYSLSLHERNKAKVTAAFNRKGYASLMPTACSGILRINNLRLA